MRSTLRRMICAVLAACLFPALPPAQAEETDLKTLQARLIRLGYEIGAADGILGQKTTAAIALAQALLAGQGFDVQATGIPDAKTAELILQEENSGVLRTLMKGSWGSRVKEVQRTLTGLNLLQGSADGKYGANTEAAVSVFEEQMAGPAPDRIRRDGSDHDDGRFGTDLHPAFAERFTQFHLESRLVPRLRGIRH